MRNMSKMARLVVILLIATIGSFAIAGIIFYAEYGSDNFTSFDSNVLRPSGAVDVDEEKAQSISGINNVVIATSSDDINIIKTDSNELKAHFHGYYTSSNKEYKPEFSFTTSGDEIIIKVEYKPHMLLLNFNSNLKLDVYLPAEYAKNLNVSTSSANIKAGEIKGLESFISKTSSGNLEAKNINARTATLQASSGNTSINGEYDKLEFNASSGEFNSTGIKAKTASFQTSSGNIKLYATADDIRMHTTSGEINAEQVIAKNCNVESSSGSINVSGNPGNMEASSTSGEIRLSYDEFASNINAGTSSGDVKIKLPEGSEFKLSHKTSSGSSNIDFPITISGESGDRGIDGTVISDRNTIDVKTSSGSLHINK